jgi:hypothetical protein
MKRRDRVRRELVEQWLAKAGEDFAVADSLGDLTVSYPCCTFLCALRASA